MRPEDEARERIDTMLAAAGWTVQDYKTLNLSAGRGVAVRHFPLTSGEADYLLIVNRKALGVVEAKKVGVTLSGVAEQSEKYITGVPHELPSVQSPLPFHYESTGVETYFRDIRDPDSRSRLVFSFHQPETLWEWSQEEDTFRSRLRNLPELQTASLRGCQIEAVRNLERSFAESRPKALVQMATGSGKTYTAVTEIYRLIKHAKARRVLFLVDRSNLGRQAKKEFQQYQTPDDGRKFEELYNVQLLQGRSIDKVSKVCISTIQRLYSMLRGEELDEELEEHSLFDVSANGKLKEIAYITEVSMMCGGRSWNVRDHTGVVSFREESFDLSNAVVLANFLDIRF